MRKSCLKLIMELIFIFILPLIFICYTSEIQVERNFEYDNEGNYQVSEDTKKLSFDNTIIKYTKTQNNVEMNNILFNTTTLEINGYWYFPKNNNTINYYYAEDEDGKENIIIQVIGNSEETNNNYLRIYDDNASQILLQSETTINYEGIEYNKYNLTNINETRNISYYSYIYTNEGYWEYQETTETINTIWGNIKQLLIDNLDLNDNVLLDIVLCYTVLWITMWILWHILYGFLELIIHIIPRKWERE